MRIRIKIICLSAIISVKLYGQDTLLINTEDVINDFKCFCAVSQNPLVIRGKENLAELKTCCFLKKPTLEEKEKPVSFPKNFKFSKYNLILIDLEGFSGVKEVQTRLYSIQNKKEYLLEILVSIHTTRLSDGSTLLGTTNQLVRVRTLVQKLKKNFTLNYRVKEIRKD
ncbi:MAG: hypothetical protein ACXVNR_00655 [Bacteroidia bacterium]